MYKPTSEKHLWFHTTPTKNLLAYGNRGGGKSHLLRFDAHMRAMSVPGARLILVRRTYPELMKSHLQHIDKEMAMLGGYYHKTEHVAYYPNDSKLFFSHVATEADSLNLLSAEFIAAYFDELSTIDWDFYVKLCASIRIGGSLKDLGISGVVRAATNPLGPSAQEVFAYFVNKDVDPEEDPDYDPRDWGSIKIQMEDNEHIDKEDYIKRFSGMPGYLKKAWLDGDFALENQLFDFKAMKQGRPYHVIKEMPTIGNVPMISYEFN
jgi:phage terminase large subunit